MIDQALLRNFGDRDGSHSSHAENPRNMHTARPCYYADFMKCHPLNFKGTEGAVGLTHWIKKMESVFNISGCAVENQGHSHKKLEDQGYFDSGCSKHMTGNISNLTDFKEFDGGYVAFGGGAKGGKITGKGIIITADESRVLLKVLRKNNTYSVDMKNIVPKKDLTCLVVKATNDESMLWRRSLGHINFKIINKLFKENLVRDHLGKFDGTSDEGFFVGYSTNSKAFRVYNTRTRKVEENLHINFLENKPIIAGVGLKWLFNTDAIRELMNYLPFIVGTNSNDFAGKGASFDAVNTVRLSDDFFGADNDMRSLDEVEVDISNISTTYPFPTSLNTRIHKDHSLDNVISDMQSGVQTRRMTVTTDEQGFISAIYEEKTHEDLYTCLFACFFSQEEPKRITNALKDPAWVEVMQEELLQFHLQKVWTLVDLSRGKRAIGTKWVFRNKKDEIGIVIKNKSRLVTQGFTQKEGIDYDKVFVLIARIKAIRLFLAYASFMGFFVYKKDVKSAIMYRRIKEEVYVCQPPGFEDPDYLNKVYKVEKAVYGLHQAPRAWYETLTKYLLDNGFQRGKIDQTLFIKRQKEDILLVQVYVYDIIFGSTKKELCTEFEKLMDDKFQMSSMGELTFFLGLQVKKKSDGVFISQDKYVDEILRKFKYADVKPASSPMDKEKALLKDSDGDDVDVHFYRSMISKKDL
nr:putative ribonuclease H-like domain-containing protein [Tanacetum cinerariifolium]